MRIAKNQILDKIYNTCNLNSEDDDIITKTMYKYKCIANESEEVQEAIYNYLSFRMGYAEQCDNKEIELIEKLGY